MTLNPSVSLCIHLLHWCISQGTEGFGSQINRCLENAEYLYDQLQRRADFELVFRHKVRLNVHYSDLSVYYVSVTAIMLL